MPIINSEPSASRPLLEPSHSFSSTPSQSSSSLRQCDQPSRSLSTCHLSPAPAEAVAATRTVQRRLFISHFLSTWNSRSFEFGATLFMAAAFPGSLLEVSIYAIARSAAAIVFSGAVGHYADRGERLKVVRNSIVFQRLATIISCALFLLLIIPTPLFIQLRPFVFAALCLFACVEKLASVLNFVAVERDWVIVIAGAPETSSNEPISNDYHEEDDVAERISEHTAQPIPEDATENAVETVSDDAASTGSKRSNSGSPGSVGSVRSIRDNGQPILSTLNARLRRIDLLCKVASPTVVALVDGGLGSRAAIAATLAANLASLPVEYGAIARVYKAVPALAERQTGRNRESREEDGAVRGEDAEERHEHGQRQTASGQGDNQIQACLKGGGEHTDAGAANFGSGRLDKFIHRARLGHDSDREVREVNPDGGDTRSHSTATVDAASARITAEGDRSSQGQREQSQSQKQEEEAAMTKKGIDDSASSHNAIKTPATSSGGGGGGGSSSDGLKASSYSTHQGRLLATEQDSHLSVTETTPLLQSRNSLEQRYSSAVASQSQSYSPTHTHTQRQAAVSTTETSLQAPSTSTTEAQSAQKPSCLDSVRAVCSSTRASLRAQACIYLSSAVLLPSLSLSLLYLNVLSFNGQTVTYLLSTGLTSWHVGLLRLGSICVEMTATWAGPWLAGRIGTVRAGMWFVNWQLLALGLAIAYFFPRSVVVGNKGTVGAYAEALIHSTAPVVPAAATGCRITSDLDSRGSFGGTANVTNGMSDCSHRMLMTTTMMMMMMMTTTGGWLQRAALAISGFPDRYSVVAAVREGHRLNAAKQPSSPVRHKDSFPSLVTPAVASVGVNVAEAAAAAASTRTASSVCRSCIPLSYGISSVIFDENTPMLGGVQRALSATETASDAMYRYLSDLGTAVAACSSLELSMFQSTPSAPAARSSVPPYPRALHPSSKLSPSGGTKAVLPEGSGPSQYPLTDHVSMPTLEQTAAVAAAAAAAPSEAANGITAELATTEGLSEMRRHDGTILTGMRDQSQLIAALVLVVGVILSRLGLWGFDLSAQALIQSGVAPSQRGSFSTTEAALQNAFELMAFASTAIWNRPAEFRFPVLVSLVAIACSAALYAVFVRRRRGHLLHLPCGTVTIADGSKNNGERGRTQDHALRGPR